MTIAFKNLPKSIQSLKQVYPVKKIRKIGHSDGYFTVNKLIFFKKQYFTGSDTFYCQLEFSINNETIVLDSIQYFTEVIRKVFPHSTYIKVGTFKYDDTLNNGSKSTIVDLLPPDENFYKFLQRHNLDLQQFSNLLKQQFNIVYIEKI